MVQTESQRKWYEKNKDKVKNDVKKYYNEHKNSLKEYRKNWRLENIEHVKQRSKKRYIENKNEITKQHEIYRINNREKLKHAAKEYRKSNQYLIRERDKYRYYNKKKMVMHKQKLQCIEYYSNGKMCCNCCGENNIKFLTIDHINNDGNIHRKSNSRHGTPKWLIDNCFPNGFQVLCWNCNLGKFHNKGICPHEEIRKQQMEG